MNRFEENQPGPSKPTLEVLRKPAFKRRKPYLRLVAVGVLLLALVNSVDVLIDLLRGNFIQTREVARFPLKLGRQEFGPVTLEPGMRGGEVRVEAVSKDARRVRLIGRVDLRSAFDRPFHQADLKVEKAYPVRNILNFLSSQSHRVEAYSVMVPYWGPLFMTWDVETLEGADEVWVTVSQFESKVTLGRSARIRTFEDAVAQLPAGSPGRMEALRFLKYWWWKNTDDPDAMRQTLEAVYTPAAHARRYYRASEPVWVEMDTPPFELLQGFGGPFALSGGVCVDEGARRTLFTMRSLDDIRLPARMDVANMMGVRDQASGIAPFWILDHYKTDSSGTQTIAWSVEWQGKAIPVSVVEALPTGVPAVESGVEVDRQMQACVRSEIRQASRQDGEGATGLMCSIVAQTSLPLTLHHEVCVSGAGGQLTPIGTVTIGQGETGRRDLHFNATPDLVAAQDFWIALRPSLDPLPEGLESRRLWGGSLSMESSSAGVKRGAEGGGEGVSPDGGS
ncbi:MAG TPA: hypothetical protein PKH31_09125 [Candidatus Sumerlaeota bacterium]|nr:hypothetical protein [Candidatus Sumerlaeota bacterium]